MTAEESQADEPTLEAAPQAEDPAEETVERPHGGRVLRGATVAPGLVLGTVHRKDYDLLMAGAERVALDEVDRELNRFRSALDESRVQLTDLRARLHGRVDETDARILDTHVTYLRDSVFIADVENLILNEQMRLEAAIGKVVGDFDRIFRLVQSDTMRQSAVDLRDVGIRVLRNLERAEGTAPPEAPTDYVLVARELSIVDMFNLSNEHVRGIVTREGSLTSHAAIFARSMRIPTITGVADLLEEVREGDFVILDATEGILRVDPDEVIRAQYLESGVEEGEVTGQGVPDWALGPASTLDGEVLELVASCGNLPEVEQAVELGLDSVGLYRTELLYLAESTPPSRDALVHHYSAVVQAARGRPVTFRLLNADSSLGIPYLFPERERNPGLGRVGIRTLFAHEKILRRQLQAILMAGADAALRIAVPFVVDCGELRRVKEILFEERFELGKAGEAFNDGAEVGVVIETPASMLGVRDLALESDFLLLNLDSLQQYVLATDRESPGLAGAFESLHPFMLRALTKACEVADGVGRPLAVFGVSGRSDNNLPLLVGAGLRRFCVPASALQRVRSAVAGLDARAAADSVRSAIRSACPEETQSFVAGFRHGYAQP